MSWGQLRSGLGKNYYVRTGVLIWCSIVGGVYPFINLLYNMVRYEKWFIDRSWLVVLTCTVIASLLIHRKTWVANESAYLDWQRVTSTVGNS